MILGMSTATFTLLHVVISIVAMVAGAVVVWGMLRSDAVKGWTTFFLATTILTSVTGFFFPRDHLLPSHVFGILSLLLLAFAVVAFYHFQLNRAWRWIYVVTALIAFYLNVFVGVVQSFLKIPFLHAVAPTPADAAFIVAQVVVLLVFVAIGVFALRSFRPEPRAIGWSTA